jgi:dolichol-phosphate mannosyltransferase
MEHVMIVLPAYNEEESLPYLLERIKDLSEQLAYQHIRLTTLVVNDGSKDNTLQVAKDFNVDVLDLQPNRGLAGALRAGLKEAMSRLGKGDIIITLDADDSHTPFLIPRMINQIREGSDLVIASRFRDGSRTLGLKFQRKIYSLVAMLIYKILKPIKGVRDYTCGFRAYRVELLMKADQQYGDKFIEQQGFGCMAEVLLKLRAFKPVIHEVPFILRYDLKRGESKMKVWKTIKSNLLLSLKR